MSKIKVTEAVNKYISPDESVIGSFSGIVPYKLWLFFLIGPLAVLSMKSYYAAVTDKGVHFIKLNMMGKPGNHDFFSYSEIADVKVGKGFLRTPLKFRFTNGRKFYIQAMRKGVEKIAKLEPEALSYLQQHV